MTSVIEPTQAKSAPRIKQRRFDWIVAIFSLWLIGGIHLDAWAHQTVEIESFFTPWHAVFYSGFFAVSLAIAGGVVYNYRNMGNWQTAVPTGYQLSLLGIGLFLAGGVGDLLWHTAFGIEENVEALLSPTHLLLAVGGSLIITGPLRSAWQHSKRSVKLADLLPALLSLALLWSMLSFFTTYANAFGEAALAQGSRPLDEELMFLLQGLGIAGILLQASMMMGIILLAVRRWTLPAGSFLVLFTLSLSLTSAVHEDFRLIGTAVLGGIAAEILYRWLKPSLDRIRPFRIFAALVPTTLYILYFATLALTGGIWWTIHLWAGAIFLAGITGWLLSYLFLPPALNLETT